MEKIRVALTLPAQTDYLHVTHATVRVVAAKCGFEESQADLISLALEEAFTHALEMGYKGVKDELKITLSSTRGSMKKKSVKIKQLKKLGSRPCQRFTTTSGWLSPKMQKISPESPCSPMDLFSSTKISIIRQG